VVGKSCVSYDCLCASQNYARASGADRAVLVQEELPGTSRTTFLCAMTADKVAPVTLPVGNGLTMTGILFEDWCWYATHARPLVVNCSVVRATVCELS
jgi:hypothetical protein